MVWDGGSKPLVVPTRWALLGVALGGAPVWPSSGGVGFTEKSVVRRPPCYLSLEQLTHLGESTNIHKMVQWKCYFFMDIQKTVSHHQQ